MVSSTGVVGKKVANLRAMVAASANFKSRIAGGSSSPAAEARVHHPTYYGEADGSFALPFATVERGDAFGYGEIGGGAGVLLRPYGSLMLKLADEDRSPTDQDASLTIFSNWGEGVISDLAVAAGVDTNLTIKQIDLKVGPFIHKYGNEQRFWWSEFEVIWANSI